MISFDRMRRSRWLTSRSAPKCVAEGLAEVDRSGRVEEVVDPVAGYVGAYVLSIEDILASAPGPPAGAGIELTDEEFDDFLRAARS